MPRLMLWGHGSFRTSYGYFKVPANMRIEFFVDDNESIDDDAIRYFEYGDLSEGVTDGLVADAHRVQRAVQRIVKNTGDEVKNYKLESILGDFLAAGAKNALKQADVWTPAKNTDRHLVDIVHNHNHRGTTNHPMVIQWCACRTNYIGDDEAAAPVGKGNKLANSVNIKPKSRCYITTATCSALGLPDDCEPLNKLRRFRDEVLRRGHEAEVEEYYATAPAMVSAIDARPESAEIYHSIYQSHLAPALGAIDRGDHEAAYRAYAGMVRELHARYLTR